MKVKVCRICLAQGRMLYDIDACNLKTSYERLTGLTDCLATDNVLQMVCWECKARLLSFDSFRAKALCSQALLSNMAPFTEQDIMEKLQSIDRREHCLESTLVCKTLESHSAEKRDTLIDVQVKTETQIEHVFVKIEREDSASDSEYNSYEHDVKCERLTPDIADMLDVRLEEPQTSSEVNKKRKSTQEGKLTKVIKREHDLNKFKCEKCKKTFALKTDLQNHLYTHSLLDLCNKAAEAELTCAHCKTVCHTRLFLLEHMKLKHNIMTFNCTDCDFGSDDANVLVEHEVLHNQNRIYKCILCQYRAIQYEHLKQHVKTVHSQEKPFRCNLCDYKCTRKCNLKLHERTHTGERPYKCDMCDYAAAQPTTLKQHILSTHAPDKPIKCNFCSYTCSQKCDMVRHERIHTGEKPFVCTHCDYRTARSNDLHQHLQRIHASEKYACDLCNYTATAKANLRKHRLRMHTKESINLKKENPLQPVPDTPQPEDGVSCQNATL